MVSGDISVELKSIGEAQPFEIAGIGDAANLDKVVLLAQNDASNIGNIDKVGVESTETDSIGKTNAVAHHEIADSTTTECFVHQQTIVG